MGLLEEIDEGELSARSSLLRETIPGYDYRAREARAETDRKVREKLRRELGNARRALDEVSDELYRRGDRDAVGTVRDVLDAIETLERRVDSASTGGGRLTGLTDASEEDVIRLIEYDASLIEDAEELVELAEGMREAAGDGEVHEAVREARHTVRDLDRAFTDRRDHLEGIE